MINSNTKTSYFASSDVSNHDINSIAPIEFSPIPVFFQPSLSSTVKNGDGLDILLTFSSSKSPSGNKSVGRDEQY